MVGDEPGAGTSAWSSLQEVMERAGSIDVETIGYAYESQLGGRERRATGTHYTPRSLTEPIVRRALSPLVYEGPAEGAPRAQWKLRSPDQILALRICDMALGAGAFLIQACRYLSERLVEAWELHGAEALHETAEERLQRARRLVAAQCLYGVDKDPMAVEVARLSLWLLCDRPGERSTFGARALRCGDSLLGLVSPAPLSALGPGLSQRTDEEAWLAADLLVGAKLVTAGKGERATARLLSALAKEIAPLLGTEDPARREALAKRAEALLAEGQGPCGRRPFHWGLALPDIFAEGGFHAVIGNPPFQGGKMIRAALGDAYREYLVQRLAAGARGHADLCAYFFLRAGECVRPSGTLGLVATNTIAQGVTRAVGLDRLVAAGYSIYGAIKSQPWPGDASLEIAQVWAYRGEWKGPRELDGEEAPCITAYLTRAGAVEGKPLRLSQSAGRSFIGSYVLGAGFVLSPEEARALIAKDARNAEVLWPYLTGDDVNTRCDQSPARWVIQFEERTEEEAQSYPDVFAIAEARIKPERMTKDRERYPRMVLEWWKHWNNRRELRSAIAGLPRALVRARVSSTHAFAFVPTRLVGSEQVVFFALDDDASFAVLQSALHEAWVIAYASTFGHGIRYTPSDCFETFPFPDAKEGLASVGARYDAHRRALMLDRGEGLTRIHRRFHDREEDAPDIDALRGLQVELDRAVARAYGWDDLALDHDFRATPRGVRFTIADRARLDLLDRLLARNHQMHALDVEGAGREAREKNGAR
jgi:hypothetical protein